MVERAGLIRFCLFNFRWIKIQCYNMNRGYATSMRFKFKIPVQFKSIVFFVGLNPTLQNG
jgi:hypothetical protein